MQPHVLVAFATKAGSTAEVASTVAEVMRERGLTVDLQEANEVRSLDTYAAVALGAALYMGRLHADARRFLLRYQAELSAMPVALFVLGPVQSGKKDWDGAQAQLNKQLEQFPWLHPVSVKLLGGKWDPAKLHFPFSVLLRKIQPSDIRDWEAIRKMAGGFATAFEPALLAHSHAGS